MRIGEVEIIRFGERFGLWSCDQYQCEPDNQLHKFMFSQDLEMKDRGTVAAAGLSRREAYFRPTSYLPRQLHLAHVLRCTLLLSNILRKAMISL